MGRTRGENVWKSNYSNITISIERITPEVASRMLVSNVHNRRLHESSIPVAMRNGQWKMNGESICFSDNGVLLDGQTRLSAIVDTGVTADVIVVRGVDIAAQATMDDRRARQLGSYLKERGYMDGGTVGTVATAMFLKDNYGVEASLNMSAKTKYQYTQEDIVRFIDENYDSRISRIVVPAKILSARFKPLQTRTAALFLDLIDKADTDDINDFLNQLLGNSNQSPMAAKLVSKLDENASNSKTLLPQRVVCALLVKSWNGYILGEDNVLTFRAGGRYAEKFPQPIVSATV